jgi:hypothetical protein
VNYGAEHVFNEPNDELVTVHHGTLFNIFKQLLSRLAKLFRGSIFVTWSIRSRVPHHRFQWCDSSICHVAADPKILVSISSAGS